MTVATLLLGASMQVAGVEQIAPPVSPAAAARVEQPRVASDRAPIAQLPPTPRAVEQPLPRRRADLSNDAAADAARAYAAILGGSAVASQAATADPTGRALSDAAAAASLYSPTASRAAAAAPPSRKP